MESNEKRGAGAAFIWYLQPLLTYEKIKKYKFFTVYEKLVFTYNLLLVIYIIHTVQDKSIMNFSTERDACFQTTKICAGTY